MNRKRKPVHIENVVDGERLRAQLTAAALDHIGDENATRKRALDLLHGALFRGRMVAKDRLEDGAGGHETAKLLAEVADAVIMAMYDFTTTHVFRSRNPTAGERFAVVAVGGYGRKQMAPSSDIDLLFLRNYKQTAWSESVTEYILYMLWDMSLKVGHASRSLDECLKIAREDHTVQTALLEARFLAGDRALFQQFQERFEREVVASDHRGFMAAKLKERDDRHVRSGASRYLVEPNLKEGKGGLRDLHCLFWIVRHLYGHRQVADLLRSGMMTTEEGATFLQASDFLWRVRCHLHFLTGRAEERITFDLQPEMARRLGYGGRYGQPAVERFMKRYFLVAKDVGVLSSMLTAKIEADQTQRLADPIQRVLGGGRRKDPAHAHGFGVEAGRLTIASQEQFNQDPANLVRIFQIADERELDIHPAALSAVTREVRRVNRTLRADPTAQAAFLSVMTSARRPGVALRLMNESGVLGRFVPEFGRIVAQMQFNMYHHYTVDEHTLRAVEVIGNIERGACATEHPLATAIFPKIVNRRALYLAMLLHDTGKGIGDQQEEGEKTATAACARLGLPEEEVALVGWLVRHHLLMSDVAQKRDIGDPRTVASFAETVGTLERLRLLLVLTVADIRAVGPGVWNAWKGQLLRDLYRLAEAIFLGGRTDEASVKERLHEQALQVKAALVAKMTPGPKLAAWLDALDDAYWVSFDEEALAWHASVAERALADGGGAAMAHASARPMPARGVTELLVAATDRPGLFAAVAAALAAAGADVSDARVHTSAESVAFDVFSILDAKGEPFGADDPGALDRLCERVRRAARGETAPVVPVRAQAARRAAAFAIEPWVRIDNELSRSATVIEVSGRDRPGLLAALSKVLSEGDVSIVSAHIDAYGERVADVFYVTEFNGAKITQPSRLEAIAEYLEAALREGEPDAPADPARNRLAVARASTAR